MEQTIVKLIDLFIEVDEKTSNLSLRLEVIIDDVAYSRADVKNLMFNLIEPKIQKILEHILKHNTKGFMEMLNVLDTDETAKQTLDFFEWMVMDSEMLKQEFRQNKLEKDSEQMEMFCKSLLGYDMIASEIVRIASVFELNEKFKEN